MTADGGGRAERLLTRMRHRRGDDTAGGWRGTDALYRGAVCGVGLVVAGILTHALELVLLGAPLLIGTVLALARPVTGSPQVAVSRLPASVEPGQRGEVTFEIESVPGAELVALRAPRPHDAGIGPVNLLPAAVCAVSTGVRWRGWGERVDLRPDYLFACQDALRVLGPVTGKERRRVVLPPVRPLTPGPLPARAAGLVGVHRSPRRGDGTDLRDIRAFQPGDRLRRVDWRVSLRASGATGGTVTPHTMHVRESHAEADADLVLAVDTRVDVVADVAEWARPDGRGVRAGGSLDTAVLTAAALAAGFLRQGDRVGLADLGRPRLSVPPGGGHRQLLRLRHQLVVCARSAGWAPSPVLRPHQAPPGALVVLLSPFLDDDVLKVAVNAARRGSRVLAVDVLPTPLLADPETPWGEVAVRVLRAEHVVRVTALREHGVPVVKPGDGLGAELASVLRHGFRHRFGHRAAGVRR